MERLSKKIIEGAIFVSTASLNEKLKEVFPDIETIAMDINKPVELDVRRIYIVDAWFKEIVENSIAFDGVKIEYIKCSPRNIQQLSLRLKIHRTNKDENERLKKRNEVFTKAIELGKIRSELLVLSRDLYGIHQEESDSLYLLAQQAENIQTNLYQSEVFGRVSNYE